MAQGKFRDLLKTMDLAEQRLGEPLSLVLAPINLRQDTVDLALSVLVLFVCYCSRMGQRSFALVRRSPQIHRLWSFEISFTDQYSSQ